MNTEGDFYFLISAFVQTFQHCFEQFPLPELTNSAVFQDSSNAFSRTFKAQYLHLRYNSFATL